MRAHRCLQRYAWGGVKIVWPVPLTLPCVGTAASARHVIAERCVLLQADRGEGWSQGMRFILGGTGVHNSRSFLGDAMLLAETDHHPASEFV